MRRLVVKHVSPTMIAALAAFAVYLALLNNFLRFHGYPLLTREVFYTVVAGAIAAGLFALTYHLASRLPERARSFAHALLVSGLVVYAVSLMTGTWYALAAGAAVAALTLLFNIHLLGPIALLASVALVAASLGLGQQTDAFYVETGEKKPGVVQKPPIIHIILDEHIGVEGLVDGDAGARVKKTIRSFYEKEGFRLFGGAYSDYFNTANAIPYALNFGRKQSLKGGFTASAKGNAFFAMLKSGGYRINVLQSGYIDYCSELVDSCTTYRATNYGALASTTLSAADKAAIIGKKMVPDMVISAAAAVHLRLHDAGLVLPSPFPDKNLKPTTINGWNAIHRFQRDLRHVEPGQVYFAHFLLPHMPYALRSDCSLAPVAEWRDRNRAQPMVERQQAYARQLLCTVREVGVVLNTLKQSPNGRNATIIIHGDHGSRLSDFDPVVENAGRFDDRSLIAGYSTLVAVRGPEIEPGYDSRRFRLSDLLHELAASNFSRTGSHVVTKPQVVLVDEKMVPKRRIALPEDW